VPYRIVFLLVPLAVSIGWLAWSSTRPETFTSVPRVAKIVVLVLLSGLLLQQSYLEYRWISTERAITAAIEPITGPGVSVHCQRFTETFFYVSGDRGRVEMRQDGSAEPLAMLTWQTCRDIRDWLGTDRMTPSMEQITAVHIATHEAMHVRGEFSEVPAECNALQNDPWVAQRLGASPEVADLMAKRYWSYVYPRLSGEYFSSDCKPGGGLDLDPADPAWPRTTTPLSAP
jgi:hypothetical protein